MAIQKISDLFGVKAPEQAVVETKPAGKFCPTIEPCVFDPLLLKKLLMWVSPTTPIKNLVIIGGKGVGKTYAILQFAARMGIDVYPISCSGKTRFADLIGTLTIAEDGSTKFVDGPLTMAYRNGGIFLGNEITRMDAGEQMRLVDVLDSHSRLTIPQTGEVLTAHPEFRFAATGNSGGHGDETGAYAGERVSSSAFMDRFLKIEMDGIKEADEEKIIAGILGNDTGFAKTMVQFARAAREAYIGNGGGCRIDISPRATILWARVACEYKVMTGSKALREALEDVVLAGSPREDREALIKLYEKFFKMD